MGHARNGKRKIVQLPLYRDGDGMKLGNLGEVPEECAVEELLFRIVHGPDGNPDPMDGAQTDGRLDHVLQNNFWRRASPCQENEEQGEKDRLPHFHWGLRSDGDES